MYKIVYLSVYLIHKKKPSLESAATPKAFGVFYTCFLLKNTVDHIKGEKLGDKQKKSGINPKH